MGLTVGRVSGIIAVGVVVVRTLFPNLRLVRRSTSRTEQAGSPPRRGTFTEHIVTITRSRNIHGPYKANPANPVLTNANTTRYFQAVGHADLFQDACGAWWGVALAMRLNLADLAQQMGRETVLCPVTWDDGEWPVESQVEGSVSAWPLPEPDGHGNDWALQGIPISAPDDVDFVPGSTLPEHFCFWGIPDQDIADEHIDFGIVRLASSKNNCSTSGVYFRLRGEPQSTTKVASVITALPDGWADVKLTLEIKAFNGSHYAFSAGPSAQQSAIRMLGYAPCAAVRPIFTGMQAL
ncbi:glycosyl hydrolase [Aspergillus insuetus]